MFHLVLWPKRRERDGFLALDLYWIFILRTSMMHASWKVKRKAYRLKAPIARREVLTLPVLNFFRGAEKLNYFYYEI